MQERNGGSPDEEQEQRGMLTPRDLLNAAQALLKSRFPSDEVFLNHRGTDAGGPCFLLEAGETKMTDAGWSTLNVSAAIQVTAFPAADGGPWDLAERMTAVQALFASGCLRTGGRTLRAAESTGSYTPERAVVKVKLEYRDDRPGETDWPVMGEIQTTIREE